MLLFLLFSLCRRYPGQALLVFVCFAPLSVAAQDRWFVFDVLHQGESKGEISCHLHGDTDAYRMSIESLVKTRFLFQIKVHTVESCDFEHGLLTAASYLQQVNDGEKRQSGLSRNETGYQITGEKGYEAPPQTGIAFTTLGLYFTEPQGIEKLYSCSLHRFLGLKKIGEGKYRLSVSENKYNLYTYEKGRLIEVDVEQPFYPVRFILKK